MKFVINQLHKKTLDTGGKKRSIQCVPIMMTTPVKEQYNIRPTQNASFDARQSATSAEHDQPSSQDSREASSSKG